jgi:hypothetical protein
MYGVWAKGGRRIAGVKKVEKIAAKLWQVEVLIVLLP